jgi:hypothetical protein
VVAALFSRPHWYEPWLPGEPSVTLPAELSAPADFERALRAALGTFASSDWIAQASLMVALELLEEPMLATPPTAASGSGWTVIAPRTVGESSEESEVAALAGRLRELSGLSVDQLAALFPQRGGPDGRMSRENFHRWLAGRTTPGDANLRRLLTLRHLIQEVARRVDDVRTWLFTPLAGKGPDVTPYEVLRRGAVTRLWPVIAAIPAREPHRVVVDSAGEAGVRIEESLRSDDAATPADEVDDSSNWFD